MVGAAVEGFTRAETAVATMAVVTEGMEMMEVEARGQRAKPEAFEKSEMRNGVTVL